jgi:DNA-binding MarR family transcriptional regulator
MERTKELDYIRTHDPEAAARLERLLGKRESLRDGNVYGERFTERQFSLVFDRLLDASHDRARILEALTEHENTVRGLSGRLEMEPHRVFNYLKELVKGNLVETGGHQDRDALFRRSRR